MSLANKWMRKKIPSFCNLALEISVLMFFKIDKAKLQKEGIFFSSSIYVFARDFLLMKKLEIEETKTT